MNTQRVEGHTQLPWELVDEIDSCGGNDRERFAIKGAGTDKKYVATIIPCAATPEQENMAFIVHSCNNIERLEKVNEALVIELMAANAQMESAAECIEKGRYDEALLHVRAMSGKRAEVIRLAKEPA